MVRVRRLLALVLVLMGCQTPPEAEILAGWVEASLEGDVVSAQELMIDDLSFPLADSVMSWIDGAEPFDSREIAVDCRPDDEDTSCLATWQDDWIDSIDGIDSGELAVTGRIEDGVVVSISSLEFDPALRFALNEHAAWLQTTQRADYEERCLDDVFARDCSELLVDTVAAWQAASRE